MRYYTILGTKVHFKKSDVLSQFLLTLLFRGLKSHVGKRETVISSKDVEEVKPAAVLPAALCTSVDDPDTRELTQEHFQNSTVLRQLDDYLTYLPQDQKESLIRLFNKYPMLFSDVPGRNSTVTHDIDVVNCVPIKQHPYRDNPQKKRANEEGS